MKNKLLCWIVLFAILVGLSSFGPASLVSADTGTYKLNEYDVIMQPDKDGNVNLEYYQKWTCLSGNIPWITVGLPNADFDILRYGDNISNLRSDNSGSWTGVYITLDKTYYANQSFSISFTVRQGHLLERLTSENKWRINYTAGWYDNAKIDNMSITLNSPVTTDAYVFTTKPNNLTPNSATWTKTNLPNGYKFNVNFQSTDGSFLIASPVTQGTISPTYHAVGTSGNNKNLIIGIAVAILVLLIIVLAILSNRAKRQEYKKPIISQIVNNNYLNQENKEVKIAMAKALKEQDKIAAYAEKNGIDDAEKVKKIDQYAKEQELVQDNEGNFRDDSGAVYSNNMLWMIIVMNNMHQVSNNYAPYSRVSCACACVSCACACACACAGGGAAGCTIKIKSGRTQ